MRTVSTGVGLCVLSGTIAACFAVSHFGGTERAFAQGAQQANTTAPEANASALMSGCSSQSEIWFNPVPKRINRCLEPYTTTPNPSKAGTTGTLPLGACDVNGDGTAEVFDSLGRVPICYNQNVILVRSTAEPQPDGLILLVHVPVLANSYATYNTLFAMAGSGWGCPYDGALTPLGWRDMDGDGDKDLVCSFTWVVANTQNTVTGFDIWFENTGYQASPPPNPYDLDQDGEVGAGDISVLLLNFD
jgi:hypothetical protein